MRKHHERILADVIIKTLLRAAECEINSIRSDGTIHDIVDSERSFAYKMAGKDMFCALSEMCFGIEHKEKQRLELLKRMMEGFRLWARICASARLDEQRMEGGKDRKQKLAAELLRRADVMSLVRDDLERKGNMRGMRVYAHPEDCAWELREAVNRTEKRRLAAQEV